MKRITPEEVKAAVDRVRRKFGFQPIRGKWSDKKDGKICGVCAAVALYLCDPDNGRCQGGSRMYVERRCSRLYASGFINAWDGERRPEWADEPKGDKAATYLAGWQDGAAAAALVFGESAVAQ